MSTFDELKNVVDDFRDAYGDFTTLNPYDIPGGKMGNHQIFTAREALSLFDKQLHTLESALEDKEDCVRHVPGIDMRSMIDLLTLAKRYIDMRDYQNFTVIIEEMISPIRSFAMLSMKNYEEKLKENAERIEKQNELIFAQKLVDSLEKKKIRIGSIWKRVFLIFSTLVVLTGACWLGWDAVKIYSNSDAMPDAMKIFVNAFFMLIAVVVADFTTRKYLIISRQNAAILAIKKADEYESIQRLSAALEEIEKRIGDIWIKRFWIFFALGVLAGVGLLGWDTIQKVQNYRNTDINLGQTKLILFVITRSFLMLIAVSVAAFAARQYSQNKSIELDYAYKVALVKSYPRLAEIFKDVSDGARIEFATKLMYEVLQDPQRKRYKGGSPTASNLLEKAQKVLDPAELSTPEKR